MTPTGPARPAAVRSTLAALAARLGGVAEGDGGAVLTGAAGLAEAGPGEVTFVESARLLPQADAGVAGALLLPPGLDLPGRNLIGVANPRLAFAAALEFFHPRQRPPAGIDPSAVVAPGAAVDPTGSQAKRPACSRRAAHQMPKPSCTSSLMRVARALANR